MAVRWAAVTFRETQKHCHRITGYEHLWMLKAHLDEQDAVLAELKEGGIMVTVRRSRYGRGSGLTGRWRFRRSSTGRCPLRREGARTESARCSTVLARLP